MAAGPHGALPHAEPRDVQIPSGTLVVIDWGARLDGYCSDCTRTIATGPLDGQAEEIYELVRRAQEEALAAVREGAEKRAVDGIARSIIEDAGHGERFGHGLGHGVGIEVHEGPRLTKQAEGELVSGNVVSVEPGVYLPGELGVRIEDLVVVTADAAEVLTSFSKQLTTVDVVDLPERPLRQRSSVGSRRHRHARGRLGGVRHGLWLCAHPEPGDVRGARARRGGHHVARARPRAQPAHAVRQRRAARGDPLAGGLAAAGGRPARSGSRDGTARADVEARASDRGGGRGDLRRDRAEPRAWRVRARSSASPRSRSAVAVGLASGALTTSTTVSGPPIVLWLQAHRVPPEEFRASLAACFLGLSLAGGAVLAAGGLLSLEPAVVLPLLGLTLAGQVAGERAFRSLDPLGLRSVGARAGVRRGRGEPGGGNRGG